TRVARTKRDGFRYRQAARKMQDDVRILSVAAEGKRMTQFMDQDRDEDANDPKSDGQKTAGTGTEEQGDHPKQRMDAYGNSGDRKTQVKAGGWGNLKERHETPYF